MKRLIRCLSLAIFGATLFAQIGNTGPIIFADAKNGWLGLSNTYSSRWSGHQRALLYTSDGGKSWKQIFDSVLLFSTPDCFLKDGKTGWAIIEKNKISKTVDRGKTWK